MHICKDATHRVFFYPPFRSHQTGKNTSSNIWQAPVKNLAIIAIGYEKVNINKANTTI